MAAGENMLGEKKLPPQNGLHDFGAAYADGSI